MKEGNPRIVLILILITSNLVVPFYLVLMDEIVDEGPMLNVGVAVDEEEAEWAKGEGMIKRGGSVGVAVGKREELEKIVASP